MHFIELNFCFKNNFGTWDNNNGLDYFITIDKKGLAALTSSFFATIRALFSDADVVHYHAEGPCAWMWIIKWFSKKRIIATIHGLDWQRAKWGGFATKYIKFGEKVAVKYADEIIVLSKNKFWFLAPSIYCTAPIINVFTNCFIFIIIIFIIDKCSFIN